MAKRLPFERVSRDQAQVWSLSSLLRQSMQAELQPLLTGAEFHIGGSEYASDIELHTFLVSLVRKRSRGMSRAWKHLSKVEHATSNDGRVFDIEFADFTDEDNEAFFDILPCRCGCSEWTEEQRAAYAYPDLVA